MNSHLILLPVLLQVLLTITLYIKLNIVKVRAAKAGDVNEERRSLHDDAWPDYVLKINNCIRNQFEVPILFYVLAISFALINAVDLSVLIMSCLFVASRVAHAYIHTGSNYVPARRKIFTFGVIIVLMMALMLAGALLSA
ncbi:MAG: MAPEG family protein [Gammaproteobacteria bacterium]|nr:MAPEG family protein [Gammaproteobacteria bacterium]MBU1833480.1 MAPEG family protein [Gammaproteobacteria bacterium]